MNASTKELVNDMCDEVLMKNGNIPQLVELIPGIYDGTRVNCDVRCFEYDGKTAKINWANSEDYLVPFERHDELLPLLFDKDLFNWSVMQATVEYHELKGVKYKWLRIVLERAAK